MDVLTVTVHLFLLAVSFWPTVFLSQKYILLRAQKETNAYRNDVLVLLDSVKKPNIGELYVTNLLLYIYIYIIYFRTLFITF